MPDKLRLAILGCGAVTSDCHLPALAAYRGAEVTALVDSNVDRAAELSRYYGLNCKVSAERATAFGEAEAVINALPNRLHPAVNLEAFEAGVHVLCEKPLAIRSQDARACCEAADKKGKLLAVGMQRRFFPSHAVMRRLLEAQTFGQLESYEWEHGGAWDWNTRSGFYFSQAEAGGGVLIDFGVHLLDELVDWFGPVTALEYQDDDWGSGIEANAIVSVQHEGRYGKVKGRLRLSRTYCLKNRLVVRGSRCRAELPSQETRAVTIYSEVVGAELRNTISLPETEQGQPDDCYRFQIDNFVQSVRGAATLTSTGRQAVAMTELIERCYDSATKMPEPWSEIPQVRRAANI